MSLNMKLILTCGFYLKNKAYNNKMIEFKAIPFTFQHLFKK